MNLRRSLFGPWFLQSQRGVLEIVDFGNREKKKKRSLSFFFLGRFSVTFCHWPQMTALICWLLKPTWVLVLWVVSFPPHLKYQMMYRHSMWVGAAQLWESGDWSVQWFYPGPWPWTLCLLLYLSFLFCKIGGALPPLHFAGRLQDKWLLLERLNESSYSYHNYGDDE